MQPKGYEVEDRRVCQEGRGNSVGHPTAISLILISTWRSSMHTNARAGSMAEIDTSEIEFPIISCYLIDLVGSTNMRSVVGPVLSIIRSWQTVHVHDPLLLCPSRQIDVLLVGV